MKQFKTLNKSIIVAVALVCSNVSSASESIVVLTEDTAKGLLSNAFCGHGFSPMVNFSKRPKLFNYIVEGEQLVLEERGLKACNAGEHSHGSFCIEVVCAKKVTIEEHSK